MQHLFNQYLGLSINVLGDRGTENGLVAAIEILLIGRHNVFLFGRSALNQVKFKR